MKKLIVNLLLLVVISAQAQNVGVGTNVPLAPLHLFNTSNSTLLIESNNANSSEGVTLRTNNASESYFAKYNSAATGAIAGIPVSNSTFLYSGIGKLGIGTGSTDPMYFFTNATQRMAIAGNGNVGINTNNPLYRLHVESGDKGSLFIENPIVAPIATVRILRGVPESTSYHTTALWAEAGGDMAAAFRSNSVTAFEVTGTYGLSGFGFTGMVNFTQTQATAEAAILKLSSPGIGHGLYVAKSGTGGDGINVDVSSVGNSGIYALNRSTSGGFGVVAESASGISINGRKNGSATGQTAVFENTNASNTSSTVEINSNSGSIGLSVLKIGAAGDGINVDVSSVGSSGIYALNRSSTGGFGVVAESASGVSINGRKNGSAIGQTAVFDNTNASNTSNTVEINSNAVGSKLFVNDNSASVNASIQVNTNAGNGVRIDRIGGAGNGLYIANLASSSSAGVVSFNSYNAVGVTNSFGVEAISGDDGLGGVYTVPASNTGLTALNLNQAKGYGIYTRSKGTSGAVIYASYDGAGTGTTLELNNGFVKVSGTNKSAFIHTATAGNSSGNITALSYASPAATDIVIVTQNYSPNNVYNNHPIGVYWNAGAWAIFNQDMAAMPVGAAFNVLVIKQ